MQDPVQFDKPYQIICEGWDDFNFFCRFIRNRGLEDDFQVSQAKGKDLYEKKVKQIFEFTTVALSGIILLADTDDDPSGRFKAACKQLRGCSLSFPATPLEIKVDEKGFKTAIVMIPNATEEGALETLLLACSDEMAQYAECINAFCAGAVRRIRKLDADKLRLRAYIAAYRVDDPGLSLSFWVANEHRPFEMDNPSLTWIYEFLVSFRDSGQKKSGAEA